MTMRIEGLPSAASPPLPTQELSEVTPLNYPVDLEGLGNDNSLNERIRNCTCNKLLLSRLSVGTAFVGTALISIGLVSGLSEIVLRVAGNNYLFESKLVTSSKFVAVGLILAIVAVAIYPGRSRD